MNQFLWGALAVLSVVAATFFWKYWKRTKEELFAAFAAGFGVLALHWAALGLLNPSTEARPYLYVGRFLAFALIIWGVIRKNRSPTLPHG